MQLPTQLFQYYWCFLLRPVRSTLRFLGWMLIGAGLALCISLMPAIAQQATPAEIGWEFLGSRILNQISIAQVQYEGDCPGTETASQEARFTSTDIPPARRRRVIVRNVTRGVASNPFPFTDREYNEGRSSEPTLIEFGSTHSSRRLRVLEGENNFEYEIRERNQVIASGTFTASFARQTTTQRRDASPTVQSVCMNASVPMNVCADVRRRTNYVCPNGRVVRSSTEPADPNTTTLLSNQTLSAINYWANGRLENLPSGRDRTFSGNNFSIQFEPGCSRGTCLPRATLTLQAGRRYRFNTNPAGYVELIDFPNY